MLNPFLFNKSRNCTTMRQEMSRLLTSSRFGICHANLNATYIIPVHRTTAIGYHRMKGLYPIIFAHQ